MSSFRSVTAALAGSFHNGLTRLGLRAQEALRHDPSGRGRPPRGRAAQPGEEEQRDAGYSTEMVLATAMIVLIALAAIGAIGAQILDAANSIDLTPPNP